MILFETKILARGLSLQGDADPWMPPKKCGRTIGIVFEKEVFHRMPFVPGCPCEARLYPSTHPGFMRFTAGMPIAFREDFHEKQITLSGRCAEGVNDAAE
jgi:hypothetical protein